MELANVAMTYKLLQPITVSRSIQEKDIPATKKLEKGLQVLFPSQRLTLPKPKLGSSSSSNNNNINNCNNHEILTRSRKKR